MLNYNTTQQLFFGGNFWDGRATGYEAAELPTPNRRSVLRSIPWNMGFPDTACIAFRLSQAVYRPLFELVWGADFDINFPSNTEQICATPEWGRSAATPRQLR